MLSRLSQWMEANKEKLTDYSEFGRSGKIFSGAEIVQHLSYLDIDAKSFGTLEVTNNHPCSSSSDFVVGTFFFHFGASETSK